MGQPTVRAVEIFEVSLKAFIRRDDRVLMVREADTGFWELPGGRIDRGEAWEPFDAILARELAEELGPDFTVRPSGQWLPLMRQRPTDAQHILLLVRVCAWLSGDLKISAEHQQAAWLTHEEASALHFPERSNYAEALGELWELSQHHQAIVR